MDFRITENLFLYMDSFFFPLIYIYMLRAEEAENRQNNVSVYRVSIIIPYFPYRICNNTIKYFWVIYKMFLYETETVYNVP